MKDERLVDHDWEAECRDLRRRVCEMQNHIDHLKDENSKLGTQYEMVLKEKSDLDRRVGFLEGQIEAYQYCIMHNRR